MRSAMKWISFCFFCFILIECNDPSFLGGDLLKEDEINLKFVDTFKLEAQTIPDTGVVVYDAYNGKSFAKTAIGNFADPIFGTTRSSLFIQFLKPAFASLPDFKGAELDSAILFLALDTVNTPYGVPFDNHDFEIHQMDQRIVFEYVYKVNNINLSSSNAAIGSVTGIRPDPKSRVQRVDITDTLNYDPHIAFRMNKEYALAIMNLDTIVYNSDSIFLSNVKGLEIKQTNPNVRMLNFNPNSQYSKLSIFYTQSGTRKIYSFPFNQTQVTFAGPRVPKWTHDFPSTLTSKLHSKKGGEEYIYLQSMGGLKAKIEFPNLNLPANAIINNAQLEFTVVTPMGDDESIYTPAPQLGLFRRDTATGNELFISDQNNTTDYTYLGGILSTREDNGITKKRYLFNISNHIQRILSKRETPEVYVGVALTGLTRNSVTTEVNYNTPFLSRVVLGGTKHPTDPVKLRISYTTY